MIDWIVDVSWPCQATQELESPLEVKALLDALEIHSPIFGHRVNDRYFVCFYVEAERASQATELAEALLKKALEACHLPWPDSRRAICDIVDPDVQRYQTQLSFDAIVDTLTAEGFHPTFPAS